MPEISEADHRIAMRALELLNKMTAHPEHGVQAQRVLKQIDPSLRFAADVADPIVKPLEDKLKATNDALEAIRAERAAEKEAAANSQAEASLRTGLGKAKDKFKLTDDGMTGVMNLMRERQIADPEAAAALYVNDLPKPAPTRGSTLLPESMNLFGTSQASADFDAKALHSDPVRWQDDTIARIISEEGMAA